MKIQTRRSDIVMGLIFSTELLDTIVYLLTYSDASSTSIIYSSHHFCFIYVNFRGDREYKALPHILSFRDI